MAKIHKSQKNTITKNQELKSLKTKSINSFLLKLFGLSLCIVLVVFITDKKGFFNPDYSNDHTRRKWNTYYEFIKKQPVDVVLVGNSHLYTGLNPDNLSNTLGANCFILASPGTSLSDSYYCLKEAIAANKPKVAIVETFTISDYDNHTFKDGALTDQFKSFAARKNVIQKMLSTPYLFSSNNYLAAWSTTIRNHNFIFTDTTQIRKNLSYTEPVRPGLYLGRYNRFMTGIEDSTLLKYDKPGFKAYDYKIHMASVQAKKYIQKIIDLCEENDVKLVFMTLPMYHRHVHNYEAYKAELKQLFGKQLWVDFQQPYDTAAFTTDCFENTVSGNQHMTYYGARVAAYKLASYLRANLGSVLPDRSSAIEWKQLFYASDGYFENHTPENDGVSQVLIKEALTPDGINLHEVSLVPLDGAKKLIVKIDKTKSPLLYGKTVKVLAECVVDKQVVMVEILAKCTYAYDPQKYFVLLSESLNPVINIQRIVSVSLI